MARKNNNRETESLFPTIITRGALKLAKDFNSHLLKEIHGLSAEDRMGQEWSKTNYRAGYTSYGSLSDLHRRTPLFMELHDALQPEATYFAKAQGWSMKGMELVMDSCWMNIMPNGAYHTLHLHPHSVISGTYYVSSPPGSVALKLEDPRMGFYMNAPVRHNKEGELYYKIEPTPGTFILFESWLRHEVPPNNSKAPRVSVSFNYSLVPKE